MRVNIFCQKCSNVMDYQGADEYPIKFPDDELDPNAQNTKIYNIELHAFKCPYCGRIQCYEVGDEPPEEFIKPPIKTQLKIIKGGK